MAEERRRGDAESAIDDRLLVAVRDHHNDRNLRNEFTSS